MRRIVLFILLGALGFGIGGLLPASAALLAFTCGFQNTVIWSSVVIAFTFLGLGFIANGVIGGVALGLAIRKGRRMTTILALFGALGFLAGGLLFVFLVPGGMFRDVFSSREIGLTPTAIWPLVVIIFAVLGFGFVTNEALSDTAFGSNLGRRRRIVATLAFFGDLGFLVGGFLFAFLVPGGIYLARSSGIVLLEGALGGAMLGLALRDGRKMIDLALAGALGFWIGLVIANYVHQWLQSGWLFLPVINFFLQGFIGGATIGAMLGYLERRKVTKSK